MLKLHHVFSLLPKLSSRRPVELSPVISESDELIDAIESEAIANSDSWSLEETINGDELVEFWNGSDASASDR